MIARQTLPQILVVCGYDLIAHAVRDRLADDSAFQVQAISPTDWAQSDPPPADILILDGAALENSLMDDYRNRLPNAHILLIDSDSNPFRIQQLCRQGIQGYLYLGDQLCERLSQAVTDIARNRTYFSPTAATAIIEADHLAKFVLPRLNSYRQSVLELMNQNYPATHIAHRLNRTPSAIYQVQVFLRELFEVETNGDLIKRARELGLIREI